MSIPARDNNSGHPEVVYRRTPGRGVPPTKPTESLRARTRRLAPAIMPLIIGFLLLLSLIFGLGRWSVNQMDQVSSNAQELGRQHSARLALLFRLRLAINKLDNEARARQERESRREIAAPFDVPLHQARDEVRDALEPLDRPPLNEEASWTVLRSHLQSYLKVTDDMRAYSLQGFQEHRTVEAELDNLSLTWQNQQEEMAAQVGRLQREARSSIRLWSLIAFLFGGLIAAGTIWEAQRRFNQVHLSIAEARRERAFTTQLLEGMVSAVAAVDEEDKIRSANAAFLKIFPKATVGASVLERLAADDAMKMLEAATSTRVERATYRGRWVATVENEEKSFDVYSSPLDIDGQLGQIVTLVDATEVAESERSLRRSESLAAVGQATTQVAHEIRNPLGSIRLGVSMLRDSVTDPEALNTIDLVERGIQHLNKLVVDVTQFSRQKTLDRTAVDLHESLERSLDLVSERIREKNAVVERQFSDQRLIGEWDADQLRQVFVNVIANAIDASSQNAEVRISTESFGVNGEGGHASKQYARVTIADHGKGMDKATRERIFEPFFSTKKRGTGLGLAIVRQIVERHGGRISVSSEPGKGSSFVIDLPVDSR